MRDTSPEIEKIQIQMFRNATAAKRFARARSLSSTVIQLSRRAIRRNHPFFSDQDVKEEFISLHYGKELAEKVRRFVEDKKKT